MPKFLKGLVSAAQLTINTLRVVVVVASWTSIPKMILAAVDPPFIVLLPAVNNGEIPPHVLLLILWFQSIGLFVPWGIPMYADVEFPPIQVPIIPTPEHPMKE